MERTRKLIQRGKHLAYLLRHDKHYRFDEHGWREVSDLMENHGYTMDELEEIVATNNKQRYEFSEDKTRIRARQGHSVEVDVELEETTPPDVLYHGTATTAVESIMRQGLLKGKRMHVHLSATVETATNVGKRHGTPVILRVDARRMYEDGVKFFLSRNGVWLTDFVDVKYISETTMEDNQQKTRNGQQMTEDNMNEKSSQQTDYFNPETNTLDNRSNGAYPSGVLSNLCSNGFRFEGMVCGSMEGFLQSLKQQDLGKQRQICQMKGGNARKRSVTSWQTDQIVWWRGKPIDRQGDEYQQLLRRAYKTMFEQNERFRAALMSTRGVTLTHTTGENNPYKTIITPQELCGILTELREDYDKRPKNLEKPKPKMNLRHVVFSHGKESGPLGHKIQRLMAEAELFGLNTISVDYRECETAEDRVALLKETLGQLDALPRQIVLGGSSMGGYVSTVVAGEQPYAGLFLMAPALWMPAEEYAVQDYQPQAAHVEITHGLHDEVVPYENSLRFVREHDKVILHLVPDDHRLKASHEFLACQFKRMLEELSTLDR